MAIQIDMSKLVRRKPNLNVSVLSFDWKEKTLWNGLVLEHFALDPKKYDYGTMGYITMAKEGTEWFASFGYNVVWEDGWDSHYPPFIKVKVGNEGTELHELKRWAELRYKQLAVPYFMSRLNDEAEAKLHKMKDLIVDNQAKYFGTLVRREG